MLPNKLKHDEKQFPSFIVDESNRSVCQVHSSDIKQEIKEAIIKRYNSYNKLVIALTIISSLLVVVSCTLIQLIRFKLV